MHVESEHSAISAAMGVSVVGARAFTATSSQGLLYMAEGLFYAAGGRFPIVMMNANRSLALPWSIYGDQSDSLSQLNSGWIQVYVEDAQETLDMVIQAYRIAEDPSVLTPFMVNLDGFVLTHTYELVSIPNQAKVDEFLPPFSTHNKMSFEKPMNMGMSTTPAGRNQPGAVTHKKKLFELVAAHGIEYAAVASIGYPVDYMHKVNRGRHCSGTSFIHVYASCPTGWGTPTETSVEVAKEAVDCGIWVLAEYENGEFKALCSIPDNNRTVFFYHNPVAFFNGFQELIAQLIYGVYSFAAPHVGHNQPACSQRINLLGKQHSFRDNTHSDQSLPYCPA
ncbi:hypothetical protein ES707_15162 [subsurface metagenome]